MSPLIEWSSLYREELTKVVMRMLLFDYVPQASAMPASPEGKTLLSLTQSMWRHAFDGL